MEKTGAVIMGGHFMGLGILRSLARHGVPTYLLDQGWCLSRFSRYAKRFAICPDARQEDALFNFLTRLARKERLEGWVIYPNDDETVCFVAKHKQQLEQYYRVMTPPWEVVKFACDKKLTQELAERCQVAMPRTFCPDDVTDLERLDIDFPVVLKPTAKEPFYRRTKKKAVRVDRRENLKEEYTMMAALADGTNILVQEMIPGGPRNLYSVGSLCKNGELLAKIVARRPRQHPMDFGHATTYAETVDIPELEESARKILKAMRYYGLSEVEFMQDPRDGKYKLLEINARAWGWHTLAIGAGVDLPYLVYRDMLGETVRQNGFTTGVKWVRLLTDVPTAAIELLHGRMKLTDYLRSLKGKKEFAVLSLKDPLPFFAEIVLLPYLWKKRGF